MTCRRIMAHKFTAKCPKCKYTSKIPYSDFRLTNKNSIHSQLCPIHRLALVKIIKK
jgi:hypothetical protein